ncbi:plancitoxin-1-like [Watersipora subatra]|uniref:plancitoxin-1-like n=1 Tax=Watersipora subatra TaxID=2589382 RepID=UPI00355B86F5
MNIWLSDMDLLSSIMKHLLSLVFLLLYLHGYDCKITCRDDNNQPVEWFVVYKLPCHYHSGSDSKCTPFPPHLYVDSSDTRMELSKLTLNDSKQSLDYTLQQAYSKHNATDVGYIMYNDEKPIEAGGGITESHGHTKGVTIFDKDSGIWLLHSVPKYPPPTNGTYNFASNGMLYGQTFLCVQLSGPKDVSNVGQQLLYNEPWIYDSNLPPALKALYPVMVDVIAQVRMKQVSNIVKLGDLASMQFISFAKNRHFKADLYGELVAPTLKCNLGAETWQHSPGKNIPSYCNQTYTVQNVQSIASESFGFRFKTYFDHSKFAICKGDSDLSASYLCIGDINRQTHQMVRGGGTVCFADQRVHDQFWSLIDEVEPCPSGL